MLVTLKDKLQLEIGSSWMRRKSSRQIFDRGFELRAFAWDTQETRHILAMLRHGIDGVYCDRVDRMVAAVGEWR